MSSRSNATRWVLALLVALAIIALIGWARGRPGLFDRDPDGPSSSAPLSTPSV